MRIRPLVAVIALTVTALASPALAQTSAERGQRWVERIAVLSDDAMEGRGTGTPGHERAAAYVIGELERLGLEPAGTDGWYQPIRFIEQTLKLDGSSAVLTIAGQSRDLSLTDNAVVWANGPLPTSVDAELVFVGYGQHMPSSGYSDLDGIDLTGKIAVYVNGAPSGMPSLTLTHARAQRNRNLIARGAVGTITLAPPPTDPVAYWANVRRSAARPGFFPEDPSAKAFMEMTLHPDLGAALFAGTPRSLDQIFADARAAAPQTSFALDARLSGRFASEGRVVVSPNVVARLPGSDPALADEYVVMTSHLDHVGIGTPVNGDAIYNGALDNASGVAAQLDIAEQLIALKPRRSVLFVLVTAEEKGLLGSRAFVNNPTVPRDSIVANLNYDMALPIIPLTGVNVLGATESTIGDHARAVGAQMGLPLTPDPFPAENRFIRSDQYSFIAAGIPAVAFKFGFAADTPEAAAIRTFNETHYHKPSDEVDTTPLRVEDEIRLHDFIVSLALRVANAPDRPTWNADSIFRE